MNIESTDSWTQGLSHTACTTLTPAFTETLNIPNAKRLLASQSPPFFYSPPQSVFSLFFFFFNRLNIFWYKNKPTYDESTMFVNCFSPFSSCCRPAPFITPSGCTSWRTNMILAPKSSLFLFTLFSWTLGEKNQKSDRVMVELGETVLKKRFNNLPEKKESNKKDFLKKVI